jgi:hypothetical protein
MSGACDEKEISVPSSANRRLTIGLQTSTQRSSIVSRTDCMTGQHSPAGPGIVASSTDNGRDSTTVTTDSQRRTANGERRTANGERHLSDNSSGTPTNICAVSGQSHQGRKSASHPTRLTLFASPLSGSRLLTVVIDEEIDYSARHRRRRRQRVGAALVAAGFAAATIIPSLSVIF